MKIHHSLAFCLLTICALFLLGCNSDPIAERNANPPASDTARQTPSIEDMDKADLKKLLQEYEPPGRVSWQKPEKVLAKIKDIENKVIADVGAGTGFFARRLAQHAKKVIAMELDPELIHYMDSVKLMELKPEYQRRFETRLVTPSDAKLAPGEVDVILIVNTFVMIGNRVAYLKQLREALPEGGQVIIVDFKRKRIPYKVNYHSQRMELYKVENDLEKAGFYLSESDDCSLDYQYIVTAEK